MNRNISCTVNSKSMTWQIDIRMSLADVLREHGYTSVKEGCGVGECGACAVLIDDVAVDSCLYLAVWADGRSIRTTEGESKDGKLSAVQQAYLDTGSVQCSALPAWSWPPLLSWNSIKERRFPGNRFVKALPVICAAVQVTME